MGRRLIYLKNELPKWVIVNIKSLKLLNTPTKLENQHGERFNVTSGDFAWARHHTASHSNYDELYIKVRDRVESSHPREERTVSLARPSPARARPIAVTN